MSKPDYIEEYSKLFDKVMGIRAAAYEGFLIQKTGELLDRAERLERVAEVASQLLTTEGNGADFIDDLQRLEKALAELVIYT